MPFIATKYAALIFKVTESNLRYAAINNSKKYTYTKYQNKLLFKVTNSQLSIALNKGLIDANIEVYNDDLTLIQDFFKTNSIRRINGRNRKIAVYDGELSDANINTGARASSAKICNGEVLHDAGDFDKSGCLQRRGYKHSDTPKCNADATQVLATNRRLSQRERAGEAKTDETTARCEDKSVWQTVGNTNKTKKQERLNDTARAIDTTSKRKWWECKYINGVNYRQAIYTSNQTSSWELTDNFRAFQLRGCRCGYSIYNLTRIVTRGFENYNERNGKSRWDKQGENTSKAISENKRRTNEQGELNANNKENSSDIRDNANDGKHVARDREVGTRIYESVGCNDTRPTNAGESKGARELKLSTNTAILTAKGLKSNSSSKASNTNETSTLNECLNERNAVGNYALLNTRDEELAAANEKALLLSKIEQRVANNESIKSICNELNISRMQYYRMLKAYKTQGLAGLVDKRTTAKVNSKVGEIIPDVLKTLALDLWRGFGAGGCDYAHLHNLLHAHAYELINYDYKGYLDNKTNELFSVKTLQAFIENYKKQNYLEALVVEKGLDKAKSYAQPSMGNQRQAVKYRNEKWQIDSSPLDMILIDKQGNEFRPHILSVIDVFSGRCVAMLSDTSNALSLVRLLWKAIDTMGLPECIKGDNGKDYLSNHFQSVLNKLGIFYENTPAYSGELKAFVERHFETLQHSFIANSAGAIGHDLAKRQAIEQRTPKKERKAKNEFGKAKKTNQTDLLSFDEATQLLENAVNYWNLVSNKRVKNRKSRIDVWNESNTELIKVTYDYFLARAGEYVAKKVQKKGININSRTYISADMPSVGTSIKVVTNIDNISEVYVYDEKFNFLCIAYDNTTANLSAEQYKEHKKAFNKELQAINKVIKDVNVGEFTRTTLEIEKKVLRELNEEKLSDTNFTILDDKSKKNYKEKGKLLKEVSSCLDYTAPKIQTINDEDEMSYEDLIKNSKIG